MDRRPVAVTEPYAPEQLIPRRGFQRASVRAYFEGTSKGNAIAFAALGVLLLVTIFARVLAPYDPLLQAGAPFTSPDAHNLLGTDELGRDILSRVLYGMQNSWWGAVAVVGVSVIFGGLIGLVAGSRGGWVDTVLMRFTDIVLALPGPVLVIAVVAAIGPSYVHSLAAIAIIWWPLYARIVRSEVRRLRSSPHVEAARLAGVSRRRLILRHLLPGAVPVTIVAASLDVGGLVMMLAGLSFLGLGAPQPAPELGAMSAQGLTYLFTSWWVPVVPAAAVALIAIVANFAGDAFRDRIGDR